MTFRRLLPVSVLVVALAVVGVITVRKASVPGQSTDFTVYLVAGQEVLKGGKALYSVTDARGLHYIYPPLFAVLMAPLSALPPAAASAAWYLITIALLLVALRLTLRLVTPEGQAPRLTLLWIPLLICADPLLGTLTRGQLGILMFACTAGTLSLHREGKSFQAGLLLAFATVIKMYTGLLGLYFIARRDWRAFWGGIVGTLLFGIVVPSFALGVNQTLAAWQEWLAAVVMPFSRPEGATTPLYHELHDLEFAKNQSLTATLTHVGDLFDGVPSAVEPDWVKFVSRLVGIAVVAALLIAWNRGAELKRYSALFKGSLAVMWGILLVPVAWTHHFVVLILPLTGVTAYLFHEKHDQTWRTLRWALVAVAILAAIYTSTSILQGPLTALGLRAVVMIPRSIGLYCAATLVLSVVLLYVLLRSSNDR